MGKKSRGNISDKNTSSRSSFRSISSQLADLGLQVSEQREEVHEKKIDGYDPDKRQRGKRFSNHDKSSKNEIPNAKVLPLKDGPYAPYNFVPFSDTALEDPADDRLNQISDSLYSGELCYEVAAQTPILVDSGKNSFYRNIDGKYALPGSTIRGLIRSNLQILSFSGYQDDIDDYRLMYRTVAGGALKDQYGNVLGQKQETINDHIGFARRHGRNVASTELRL